MGLDLLMAIHLTAVESHHVAVSGKQPGEGLGIAFIPAAQNVRVQFAGGQLSRRRGAGLRSAHTRTPAVGRLEIRLDNADGRLVRCRTPSRCSARSDLPSRPLPDPPGAMPTPG